MFIFTNSGFSFIHSSKFFESPHSLTCNLSCCTKISPDHLIVMSHSKWRLTVNFLKNSHSFSEYSIFTYSFALLLCLLLCTLFSEQYFFKSFTKFKYLCFFTTTYHTRFLMDPPLNTGTSVSSGSCFSTLPSGLQPSMTSLEACTSWLRGVSQSPPVESRPVTGVPLPPQACAMSSWSVNSLNSLGRPISQQPASVGNFVPSAQPIQAVPAPAGYPVYDQSFHRPPYQPQADFFYTFSSFMSSM